MEAYEDESSEARNALEDISMCIEALAGDIRDGMNGEDKIIEELERIRRYAYRIL